MIQRKDSEPLRISTSSDHVSEVYKCDSCGREQYAAVFGQSNGLTPNEARRCGWRGDEQAVLCPMCADAYPTVTN